MLGSLKEIIKQCNYIIKKENRKINNLYKQVEECEAVISVVSQTDKLDVGIYQEKINDYYLKIERALEKVQHNRDIIAKIKMSSEIIRRGEKVA